MTNSKIFISHASEDKKDIVEPLCKLLKNNNLKIWYDNDDIKIGEHINQSVIYGIQKYDIFILILTPSYLKKKWTNFEFGGACTFDVVRRKKIIPIFCNIEIKKCLDIYPFLGDIKGVMYDGSLDNLCKTLTKELEQKTMTYCDLKNSNLVEIYHFLGHVNNIRLFELSGLINQFVHISQIDPEATCFKAYRIVFFILKDVESLCNTQLLKEDNNNFVIIKMVLSRFIQTLM